MFTSIYASANKDRGRVIWEELFNISKTLANPWLIVGDFNDIFNISEKKGVDQVLARKCELFRDCVNNCKHINIGTTGSKFT